MLQTHLRGHRRDAKELDRDRGNSSLYRAFSHPNLLVAGKRPLII
ncbi:hypothetical protein [[Phormidium] sp. ETS-05]|nr:hypothetical protein [[Phormidium] sp. ETS-05]